MDPWWVAAFGDPCRGCGFSWTTSEDQAIAEVSSIPDRFGSLLSGKDGSQHHPELSWSAKAYVFHVADNLRIWGERLAASCAGAVDALAEYDDNLLAEARSYEQMPLQAAMWSLQCSVQGWLEAVQLATQCGAVLHHPHRGILRVPDVVRSNCHDAHHHEWDIQRILSSE
jgi:hypothetical protein